MAAAAARNFYLNLHQCVYSNGRILYTNLLPNTANPTFNTGTQVSGSVETSAKCGNPGGGWREETWNSAEYNFDRFGQVDRYLNLHQCVYSNGQILYTNLLPNTRNTDFNTGTNVASSAETASRCGNPGGGWQEETWNSAEYSLDLTGRSGRYLNLHQCVYNNGQILYTNLLPNTRNTDFNTGTNVSNTEATSVQCGNPGGGWRVDTANSAVFTIDLLA
ncbi:hypothetical protein [Streptomyces violaceusniger]|uniref:hypothetical protein n=1 Tax=Streptomyces violaceusniger TaxID=68280 RepID=UPI00030CADDA|nr:hypothetical protein [Streptomyces violaceusniger]